MNKKDYPLSVLADWARTLKDFRAKALKNSDILSIKEDNEDAFEVVDKDGIFFYRVTNPRIIPNSLQTLFTINYAPVNRSNTEAYKNEVFAKDIATNFETWLNIIMEYETITLTEEEQFARQYEAEFEQEFTIVDEDADTKSFEHEKQVGLYNLLTYIEERIPEVADNKDETVIEIIEEAGVLKNNIQRLTKKKVIQSLSKLFAKIKMKGIKLFIEVIDIAKKEAIKKLIGEGADYVVNNWHHFPHNH
jgi:hypothetical protein